MIQLIKGLLWLLGWIKKKTTEGQEWKTLSKSISFQRKNSFRNQKIQGPVGIPTPFLRSRYSSGLRELRQGQPLLGRTLGVLPGQVTKSSCFTPFSLSKCSIPPGKGAVQLPSWFLFTLETLTPFQASQNESCVHTKPQQPANSLNPMK